MMLLGGLVWNWETSIENFPPPLLYEELTIVGRRVTRGRGGLFRRVSVLRETCFVIVSRIVKALTTTTRRSAVVESNGPNVY